MEKDMKRFLLFEFPDYYPSGGVHDLEDDFDTLKEAQDHLAGTVFAVPTFWTLRLGVVGSPRRKVGNC